MTAAFCDSGRWPSRSVALHMTQTKGSSVSTTSRSTHVGSGSAAQVLGGELKSKSRNAHQLA